MFGYVLPDKPNLLIKDYETYRANYCGLCKALGRETGELSRFLTNYDCTFLSIFLHNIINVNPTINLEGCILNEFKKKHVVADNEIMRDVAAVTVLLTYYKVLDDVADEGNRKIIKVALSKKRKKISKKFPDLDKFISKNYEDLRALESQGETSLDKLAHCFAVILQEIITAIGRTEDVNIKNFAYQLGRWMYFMDAIDDIEKDAKSGSFNPILLNYGEYTDRKSFLEKNYQELRYLLFSTLNTIIAYYDKIEVKIFEGILSNIVYKGLYAQSERVLKGEIQCQKIRI